MRCGAFGGGSRLYAPIGDQPRPLRPVRAEQGKVGALSLRRLGGAGRGVVWRANQGPRASPAKRVAWGEDEQGSGASFRRQAETERSGLCEDDVAPHTKKRFRFGVAGGRRPPLRMRPKDGVGAAFGRPARRRVSLCHSERSLFVILSRRRRIRIPRPFA